MIEMDNPILLLPLLDKYSKFFTKAEEIITKIKKNNYINNALYHEVKSLVEDADNGKSVRNYSLKELRSMKKADVIALLDSIHFYYHGRYVELKPSYYSAWSADEMKKGNV